MDMTAAKMTVYANQCRLSCLALGQHSNFGAFLSRREIVSTYQCLLHWGWPSWQTLFGTFVKTAANVKCQDAPVVPAAVMLAPAAKSLARSSGLPGQ